MILAARPATASSSLLVVLLLLTGCGGTGPAAPGEPALPPSGPSAHVVSYRCTSGREGTIELDVPDLAQLADNLNRIQPCEYDQGLSRATVTVMCRSSPLAVRLQVAAGEVAQPTSGALCQ